MSIVSKDIIFHVKFDLDSAKKDLEKKRSSESEEHPQSSTRGAPHKESAKKKRGLNTAEQVVVTNAMLKGLKGSSPLARSARTNTRLRDMLSHAGEESDSPEMLKKYGRMSKILSHEKAATRLSVLKFKKMGAAAQLAAKSDIFSPAFTANIATKSIGFAKNLFGLAKSVSPALALYTLAKNSPMIAAGYATAGLSGLGGDWLAVNLSKAKGYAQDAYLGAKGIVGRPIAFVGYDNDMAKQGRKGYSATVAGVIGGSNLGTIKYDIDQAQTRLQNAFDRCQSMQVGQSYGKAWTETGVYKGIYDVSLRTCDAIGSLFRKR